MTSEEPEREQRASRERLGSVSGRLGSSRTAFGRAQGGILGPRGMTYAGAGERCGAGRSLRLRESADFSLRFTRYAPRTSRGRRIYQGFAPAAGPPT